MAQLRTLHTSDLDTGLRRGVRALLDAAFGGDFGDADWDHTLGGMHALVLADGELLAHGCVVQRRLLHSGRALRTGYVEGVAVCADRRGRGHGAAVMAELERIVRAGYDVGALSAADGVGGFYVRRGWRPWRGPTSVLAPAGITPTPDDDGGVHVLPVSGDLDVGGALVCDWREGDVW
ncbi:aminoglycoside 2'-N-acetyltransferase I [Kineococcus xinjiangensis]|uniref:Aminoglycoside 2'-N-acetyltransferase I n=1 Tax=Kineococcus xinjiangensis TaxID=512762 RepID=A0A2S6IW09_9ACTN|nr:GNAT family N-acetyltransferase [Kineococcus xinjiangensis]PPK98466.1 aminoglycoside 2'-N-acetyltransferase I [Kineococcus xinjiangensis]